MTNRINRTSGIKLLSVISSCFLLFSCGGKNEFEKITFEIRPENPIVIKADTVYCKELNGDTGCQISDDDSDEMVPVEGPWFRITPYFDNQTEKTLTIVTLELKITSTVKGVQTTSEFQLDPGNIAEDRYFLGEVLPGANTGTSGLGTWFIHGLAETDNNLYLVEVNVIGWVGPADNSNTEGRIQKTLFFSTQ